MVYSYSRYRKRKALGGFGSAGVLPKAPTVFSPQFGDVPTAPNLQTTFTPEFGLQHPDFIPPPGYHGGPTGPGTYNPPVTSTPGGPPTPPAPDGSTFDPNTDPIVAAILAQNDRDRRQAHASMLAAEEQLLQAFGDPTLAASILGSGDPTIAGISSDYKLGSTSTLARLAKAYDDTVTSNEDQLNKANLFFSGTRAKRLSDLSYQKNARLADAKTALDQAVQAQADRFNAEKQAEADRYLSGIDAAYTRWLQQHLGTGGGDKKPPDGTPPPDGKQPPPSGSSVSPQGVGGGLPRGKKNRRGGRHGVGGGRI